MTGMLQEVRSALRMFAKSPGPSLAAVLTLALGIGANTAIFTLANASMWKPVPQLDLENITMVMERAPQGVVATAPAQVGWDPVTPGNYSDWKRQAASFEKFAACKYASFNLGATGGEPERVLGGRAESTYSDVLRVRPVLGRWFSQDEDQPGRDAVIVLGYGLWQRRYGGSSTVLGTNVYVDGRLRTVIGVMPKDFHFPLGADLWAPLALTPEQSQSRASHELLVLSRLKPGVSRTQAAAEMQAIGARLERAYPDTNRGWSVRVMPMRDFVTPDPTREMWYILMGTMLLVLLVACVNVATLQLARLTQRVHEMGVRSAMGAGAARLARQLLTESVLLSAAGALLGLLIATWAADAFNGLLPAELGKYVNWDTRLDPRTLLFTAAVALAAGIAAGVAPALHFSRPDVNNLLREGGRGTSGSGSRQRLTGLLVIAQVATTAVLLVGSALCVQSFNKMGSDPDGIGPSSLAVLRMNLNEATYALPQQKRAFAEELARKARTLPGVAQAAVMNIAPHTWQSLASPFEIEGVAVASSAAQPFSLVESVGPEYFRTLRISLRNGRGISAADGPEAPRVAVVSQGLVRRYFPDGNALGKRIRLKIGGEWLTVVDLAADFHQHGYDKLPRPVVYVPYAQMPTEPLDLAIRVSGTDAAAVIPAAQALIRSMDPQQPVYEARTLSEIIEVWELFGMRLAANMMGALGLLALVLATVGLYGVLSYAARQRTREIGVRIALGAPLRSVRLSVVRRGLVLAGTGLAIGLTLSFAATRAIASLLYGIRGTDPATFGGAAVALLGIALAASYLPAWRAGRVDPVETLRHE